MRVSHHEGPPIMMGPHHEGQSLGEEAHCSVLTMLCAHGSHVAQHIVFLLIHCQPILQAVKAKMWTICHTFAICHTVCMLSCIYTLHG